MSIASVAQADSTPPPIRGPHIVSSEQCGVADLPVPFDRFVQKADYVSSTDVRHIALKIKITKTVTTNLAGIIPRYPVPTNN